MTDSSRRWTWLAVLLLAAAGFAIVAIPVYLIRPFTAQSPGMVAIAYALRRWSPWLTPAILLLALVLVARLWGGARVIGRVVLVLLVLVLGADAWMARQNHFEWMFAPLSDSRFIRAGEARAVASGDMVLAVAREGDAAAYPVRQLAYHHLVEDAIGGVPIVATY